MKILIQFEVPDEMGLPQQLLDELDVPQYVNDARLVEQPGRIVLVTGNPADGFVLGGPFRTSDEAITWAETNYDDGGDTDWWVMEIEDVEPDEPAAPAAAAP